MNNGNDNGADSSTINNSNKKSVFIIGTTL